MEEERSALAEELASLTGGGGNSTPTNGSELGVRGDQQALVHTGSLQHSGSYRLQAVDSCGCGDSAPHRHVCTAFLDGPCPGIVVLLLACNLQALVIRPVTHS